MTVESSLEREGLQVEKEGFVHVWFSFFDFVCSWLDAGKVWPGPWPRPWDKFRCMFSLGFEPTYFLSICKDLASTFSWWTSCSFQKDLLKTFTLLYQNNLHSLRICSCFTPTFLFPFCYLIFKFILILLIIIHVFFRLFISTISY